MAGQRDRDQPSDLPPDELRSPETGALRMTGCCSVGSPSGAPTQNLERIAAHKARKHARQNRHPPHPTVQ
jgi:hypothetical protein